MADVELVIKISEKVYNALTHIEFDANLVTDEMRKSIANGTPLPSIESERKTGEWIEHERVEETYQGYLVSNYECDQCHEWVMNQSNYCPNCGAKMEVDG